MLSYSIMEFGYEVYKFMDSWSEKATECLFIIFANANVFFFNANIRTITRIYAVPESIDCIVI